MEMVGTIRQEAFIRIIHSVFFIHQNSNMKVESYPLFQFLPARIGKTPCSMASYNTIRKGVWLFHGGYSCVGTHHLAKIQTTVNVNSLSGYVTVASQHEDDISNLFNFPEAANWNAVGFCFEF